MNQEIEQMVINHSPHYLGSQAFREALALVFQYDREKYIELVEMEYRECKPEWDKEPKDYTEDLDKIVEYLEEHNLDYLDLCDYVGVSIHKEDIIRGFEREENRAGDINSVALEYGDLLLWDNNGREYVKSYEISHCIEDVIKAFWKTVEA